jgi:hypothetical protein
MRIENLHVYDLEESLIASGYPMRTELPERHADEKDIRRGLNLTKASNGNGAHGQWLTGVRVAFDLTCTNKMWVEAERYRFLEFVSSQSTMHRITKFDLSNQYCEYVDERVIAIMNEKVDEYNKLKETIDNLPSEISDKVRQDYNELLKKKYLEILYTNPAGFELTARMTTNYRCLLNIYVQRRDHRLPEWREFCQQLLTLPMFQEIVDAYYAGKVVAD